MILIQINALGVQMLHQFGMEINVLAAHLELFILKIDIFA